MFEYIIIGAGLAGIVMAERITNILDKKVLIIEKRNHIGGNCYDYYDENGILIHKYGPHIFRTNNVQVWDYLSQFTDWHLYNHEVLGFIDGKKIPIPFNLNSLNLLLPKNLEKKLEKKLINIFGYNETIPILELLKYPDDDLKFLAKFIYDKIYLNYNLKQWGLKPEQLDPLVTNNVPIHLSKDNRYFREIYQGLPKNGYSNLFKNMLNKNIKVLLNTESEELIKIKENKIQFMNNKYTGKLIFTGEIDKLFNYEFGELPYRSLKFEFENINEEYFQEKATINYPNNYKFTRITEFKHLTGQKTNITTIAKEYPKKYIRKENDIPYYPIPQKENEEIYNRYINKASNFKNMLFLGRLAEYKYYNMSNIVERALKLFDEMII